MKTVSVLSLLSVCFTLSSFAGEYTVRGCADPVSKQLAESKVQRIQDNQDLLSGVVSVKVADCEDRWEAHMLNRVTTMEYRFPTCGAYIEFKSRDAAMRFAAHGEVYGQPIGYTYVNGVHTWGNVDVCGNY